jgi:chitin synthase
MADTIYTNIGASGLVALNPHKYISSNADPILQKYAAQYRDSSEQKEPLPPHIFQIANNAYYSHAKDDPGPVHSSCMRVSTYSA